MWNPGIIAVVVGVAIAIDAMLPSVVSELGQKRRITVAGAAALIAWGTLYFVLYLVERIRSGMSTY